MSLPSPTPETPINPGILKTVLTLRQWGFNTCDSGDGETHDFACDRDHPYVVINVPADQLVSESRRLFQLLLEAGVNFDAPDPQTDLAGWQAAPKMDCFYAPEMDAGYIDLRNIVF